MNAIMEHPPALHLRPIELAKTSSKVQDAEVSQTIHTLSVFENRPTLAVDDVPDGGFDAWLIVFACSTITYVPQ
jgi:hypothetical protein